MSQSPYQPAYIHPQPQPPQPPIGHPQRRESLRAAPGQAWAPILILGSLAIATLTTVPQGQWLQKLAPAQQSANTSCRTMFASEQRLSREQLHQFITLAPETLQTTVHETIASPYCLLSSSSSHQREAYPLAFEPDTWFVVEYDQGTYQGYDFVFKQLR